MIKLCSDMALSNPKGQIENCLNFLGTRWVWSGIRHLSQGVMVFIRYKYYLKTTFYPVNAALFIYKCQICLCSVCFWIDKRLRQVTAHSSFCFVCCQLHKLELVLLLLFLLSVKLQGFEDGILHKAEYHRKIRYRLHWLVSET